ncbi:hypothetical protein LTS15_007540 [Exophiala xenobiotica]|nr:hypothetical protein LTS15_007540 [Exophiala xenobiotica]
MTLGTAILAAVTGLVALGGDPLNLQLTLQDWTTTIAHSLNPIEPTDYMARAKRLLQSTPLIDGHNDFPYLIRQQMHNQIYDHDFHKERIGGHSDFQKMKDGMMGGQFWSVYVPCPEDLVPGVDLWDKNKRIPDLNEPNWAVRDTLEQIDITKRLVAHYPDLLEYCDEPSCVRRAHRRGKIASMLGVEGGHQTGNSLGSLRLFFEAGVRYMTITHNCDNAFAASWVSVDLKTGKDSGLTKYGEAVIREMNRLGMLVDLSHVSPNTMRQALEIARAPVIFSHSGAYSVNKHLRNVPDDVLEATKRNGGVVMVPAITFFMNWEHPEEATLDDLIDHIFWIADKAGWEHVGLGSDFDGSASVVKGLEDTSQWPNLIAKLLARGNVTDAQVKGLLGDNVLRVWAEAERLAKKFQAQGELPCEENWEGRVWETVNHDPPKLFPEVDSDRVPLKGGWADIGK